MECQMFQMYTFLSLSTLFVDHFHSVLLKNTSLLIGKESATLEVEIPDCGPGFSLHAAPSFVGGPYFSNHFCAKTTFVEKVLTLFFCCRLDRSIYEISLCEKLEKARLVTLCWWSCSCGICMQSAGHFSGSSSLQSLQAKYSPMSSPISPELSMVKAWISEPQAASLWNSFASRQVGLCLIPRVTVKDTWARRHTILSTG